MFQVVVGGGMVLALLLVARTGWSFGVQTVVLFGLAALVVVIALRFRPRLPPGGVEEVDPDEVMPGAEGFVSEFEAEGFRRIGGHRWTLRGRPVTATVLAPADRESYAIVTDRVIEVSSMFGGRTLTTINEGRAPLPADILRQTVLHGSPAELVRAHRAAVDLLAERRLRPDRFRGDSEILAVVRAAGERELRLGSKLSLPTILRLGFSAGDADRELGYDEESRRRIEAWLSSSAEPMPRDACESL
jgi:membrane protein implicated in regulation of membrane protease activity